MPHEHYSVVRLLLRCEISETQSGFQDCVEWRDMTGNSCLPSKNGQEAVVHQAALLYTNLETILYFAYVMFQQ